MKVMYIACIEKYQWDQTMEIDLLLTYQQQKRPWLHIWLLLSASVMTTDLWTSFIDKKNVDLKFSAHDKVIIRRNQGQNIWKVFGSKKIKVSKHDSQNRLRSSICLT